MESDVIIVGGALVGASLALALKESGLGVTLVEASPAPPDPRECWDARIYAFSPASRAFLDRLGVWAALDAQRLCPVERMEIFGDDGRSHLGFSAYDAGVAELACIVENSRVLAALEGALSRAEHVTRLRPARCAALEWAPEAIVLKLEDGRAISARLVVGADGAESWVRAQAGLEARERPYGHTAVVANFATAQSHGGAAFQWFRDDGALALLPLPGNRTSMVWSAVDDLASELLQMDASALCARVEDASRGALGALELITPPKGFALRLIRVPRTVAPRLALVGDAAHVVHPLAGQGVNLGFADAEQLAAVLARRGPQPDAGDMFLLRRYERSRKEAVLLMQATTDGLQRLFGARWPGAAWLRNRGLALTDLALPVRNALVQHALG